MLMSPANIKVNDGEIARDLAIAGIGLTLLPKFFVLNQLNSGELVEVLEGELDSYGAIYAVYPQCKHITPKVRAFIDFMISYFNECKI